MKLYKIITPSLKLPVIYIKAKSIEDCLFKARKKYEQDGGLFGDKLFEKIKSIEKISEEIIE